MGRATARAPVAGCVLCKMAMLGSYAAALLAALLGAAAHLGGADNQCYVCIPREGSSRLEVAREFNTSVARLLLCDGFHIASSVDSFRMKCPDPFSGCTTQINGSHVTRTCANMLASDCKEANHIRYCYCKEPLCNGRAPRKYAPPPDDEDVPEHSGEGPLPPDTAAATPTPAPQPTSDAASNRTLRHLPLLSWLLMWVLCSCHSILGLS